MMHKISKSIEPKWLIVAVFFISGVFLGGIGLYVWFGASSTPGYKIHPPQSGYKYINPLLGVEFQHNSFFSVNKSIELKMSDVIDESKKSGKIDTASIYLRDLESGYWAGINEDAKFSPGKLLKTPLMIAYLKIAEGTPSILENQITNNLKEENNSNIFLHNESIMRGETYTTKELIDRMIINSDDVAANLLFDNIDTESLSEVFSDLGISFVEDKDTQDYVSLKLYGLFFRVLYNSTYLNREFSEKALALLAKSDTNFGFGASIPKEVSLVQKFGGRKYLDGKNVMYEMYDCGIVYYPEHPYLLCASAKGVSIEGVTEFFKKLSRDVYAEMEYKYKK